MYELLKYIHIVAAIVWLGGAVTSQLFALRAVASKDPTDLARLGRIIEYVGLRVFFPAAIILFIAGVIMTIQRWSFGQAWISIAILLWLASVLVGALYLGPNARKTSELFEAEGPTSEAARARMMRGFFISRLELVSFAVIVALMVFKPGTGAA